MPEYDDTSPIDNTQPEENFDPLGIMGWVIGGKYKIHGYLGGGGFGEVYEATNENLPGQRLVIKFFKRVQAREKFAKEAKILCMLDHPNISRVIDYLPEEGAVVVAFIDGKDGGVILKESGPLPEELFLKLARGITGAIAYAHGKKIAHRDIKPGNIIVDKNENVYLIDFGIAKEMGTEATKTAYTALTPMFAAPERQSGEKGYNPFLSDVYETGITLFNLATNSLPYRNPTNPLIDEWGGMAARRLSPELTRILKKATHPVPARRYESAAAMHEELNKLKVAFGGSRKRSPWPIVAGLVIILAVAGYFGRGYISDYLAQSPSEPAATPEVRPAASEPEPPPEANEEIVTPADVIEEDQAAAESKEAIVEEKTQPPQMPPVVKPSQPEQPEPEQKPVEEVVAQEPEVKETPIVKPEAKPQPPPKAAVFLAVIPDDSLTLTVGGVKRQSRQRFEIEPGKYEVIAVHPDFPVYRRQIEAAGGPADLALDLAELSGTIDTIGLQIAIIPPTENHILELKRNGRRQMIYNFPYLGLTQMSGDWEIEAIVKPIGAAQGRAARVDSCVIFPFDPGLRNAIKGSSGILRVNVSGGVSVARLLIYWSEN